MQLASSLRSLYLRLLGPKWDRPLYRRIARSAPQRIVEIGLGDASRAVSMIAMAQTARKAPVHYCGIDLFEAREHEPLPLKRAHHVLTLTGAKVRLVPGDVGALARHANFLMGTDLLVLDATVEEDQLAAVDPFLARMLNEHAAVAHYSRRGDGFALSWYSPGHPGRARQAA